MHPFYLAFQIELPWAIGRAREVPLRRPEMVPFSPSSHRLTKPVITQTAGEKTAGAIPFR